MYDALGQGEGVMAAETAREPLTIDAENRLGFIEKRSSYEYHEDTHNSSTQVLVLYFI